jgi:hypothetical protein
MWQRTLEEIIETPVHQVTGGELARLARFLEEVLGERRSETTRPFAQLPGPDARLGDVAVSPIVQVAGRAIPQSSPSEQQTDKGP